MKARRLDEVLEECLSAYLDGRRTIDESLSLYPSLHQQLEPLLRTAVELIDTLGEAPPEHVEERIRQEFLTNASVRQRAKLLTYDLNFPQRVREFARKRRRLLFVGAFAVGLAVAGAVAAGREMSSHQTSPQAGSAASPIAPVVGSLRDAQQQLWRRANQGVDVSPEMIRSLSRTTTALDSQVGDFGQLNENARIELERAIADQYLLLHLIANTQPAPAAPEAQRALGVTQQVARTWGIDLPQLSSEPSAVPAFPAEQSDPLQPAETTPPSSPNPPSPPEKPTPRAGSSGSE